MVATYLDYNSTTPVDPRVLDSMMPAFSDKFRNPSGLYGTGGEASKLVDYVRV